MWLRMVQLQQGFGTSEMGFNSAVAGQQFQTPNASKGQKQKSDVNSCMSGFPSKADLWRSRRRSEPGRRENVVTLSAVVPASYRRQTYLQPRTAAFSQLAMAGNRN